MCSTCDCDKSVAQVESDTNQPAKTCRKCGSDPFIVFDKVHIECAKCFLESCNRKLRSTVGKSMLLKNNDPILIAYSGGPSSTALLDLVKNSMEYEARREQKFRPSIVYVDTQASLESDANKLRGARLKRLPTLLSNLSSSYTSWPVYWTTIELSMLTPPEEQSSSLFSVYDPSLDLSSPQYDRLLNNQAALVEYHQATQHLDLTDRHKHAQDETSKLIDRVVSSINSTLPTQEQFRFVFVGSSASQLANDLLVNVILGQGSTIHSTVNICDRRPAVPVLRPMRDFSKKEVAFYLLARKLDAHVQPNLVTFAGRKDSIQTVTEAFLGKLYIDYPSTYSTLLRTGNKMQDS